MVCAIDCVILLSTSGLHDIYFAPDRPAVPLIGLWHQPVSWPNPYASGFGSFARILLSESLRDFSAMSHPDTNLYSLLPYCTSRCSVLNTKHPFDTDPHKDTSWLLISMRLVIRHVPEFRIQTFAVKIIFPFQLPFCGKSGGQMG